MVKNSYLTHYVHGCRRFRKFGDYWLSQYMVNTSKEKMEGVAEYKKKHYPDAIIKVFKVRCHGRSWSYGVYWITPQRMKQQDKEKKGAESFSAEKVEKEILEDGWQVKFSYKNREGKLLWSDNEDGKGGTLSFGDNPFKREGRMSRLPHAHTIDSATSKLAAKEMFRIMLDKPCESCGNAIHNKDIGACGWCEDDWDKKYKFNPEIDLQNDKWWKNLSDRHKDLYNDDLSNKNPYCRDCLYYYGLDKNYPNKFDKESANYYLGNAVCEKHWDEIVAEGGLSKDTKRYSLYEIETVSPRERMMKERFGFGSETFEADTNKWKVGDRVKILNTVDEHGFKVGEIVTITRVQLVGAIIGHSLLNVVRDWGGSSMRVSSKNVELVKDKYIPKYKVGDILNNTLDSDFGIEITALLQHDGCYRYKYISGPGEGIYIEHPIESIDNDTNYELVVPPKINPRKARLQKRFGFSSETFEANFNEELPCVYKTGNVNTAYCICNGVNANLCQTTDRYGQYGHGFAGVMNPTCSKCISLWKNMSQDEKEKLRTENKINGYYSESFSAEHDDLQLNESIKRTKMSMIRTGLAITTFTIVMWNLWTNKKQEKDISEIMDMI